MKEKLRIHGGVRLEGEVTVSGGKNAAVAIIPAALLADSPSTIENIPDINDVHVVMDMLRWLGARGRVQRQHGLDRPDRTVDKFNPPYELACSMRASYYFAPVLLGVFHRAEVPLPGGCDIGARPIDQTVKGMQHAGRGRRNAGRRDRRQGGRTDRRGHLSGYAERGRDGQQHADRGFRLRHDLHSQRGEGAAHRRSGELPVQHGRVGQGRGHGRDPHSRRQASARHELHSRSGSDRDGHADDRRGGYRRRRRPSRGAIPTHMEALSRKAARKWA